MSSSPNKNQGLFTIQRYGLFNLGVNPKLAFFCRGCVFKHLLSPSRLQK